MFELSEKARKLQAELNDFMDAYIYPNEEKHHQQIEEAENRWAPVPIIEELSHGHVKISRGVTLPVEPLPGELLPVEPLPENIWNASVGYSPCQSPKLDLEEFSVLLFSNLCLLLPPLVPAESPYPRDQFISAKQQP